MTTKTAVTVEASAPSYVLPAPKRGASEVIVTPPRVGAALERGRHVARVLGDRFLLLAECQQQFLAELRSRLVALDGDIAEDSRARLKGALKDAVGVLDWCHAVQVDLQNDSRRAAAGLEPLDLSALCAEVAAAVDERGAIQVSGSAPAWWGDAVLLAHTVRQGLALVAERTGGIGGRHIEVGAGEGGPWIRIAGVGEPGDSLEVDSVRRFRQAVAQLNAKVVPDALGPGGAGLMLLLPGDEATDSP